MRLKTALKVLGAAFLVLTVVLIGAVKSMDMARLQAYALGQISAALGRQVTMTGPLELRMGAVPRVVANGVVVADKKGTGLGPVAKIQKIEAEISLMQLIKREIRIHRLIIHAPDITLESDAKGRSNWDFSGGDTGRGKGGDDVFPVKLSLREVRVKNGRLRYVDGALGHDVALVLHKMSIQPEAAAKGAFVMQAVADHKGVMLDVGARLGAATAGKPAPVRAKATFGGWVVVVDGTMADPWRVQGLDMHVSVQGDDVAPVLPWLVSGLPVGLDNHGPLRLAGRLTGSGTALALADMELAAGRRDRLLLNAKGRVGSLADLSGVDVVALAESDNLAGLSALAGRDMPAIGPVKLGGQVSGSKTLWKLADAKLSLGRSEAVGDFSIRQADGLVVDGRLHATALFWDDLVRPAAKPGEVLAVRGLSLSDDGKVFSAAPWPLPTGLSLDVALGAARMAVGGIQLTDLSLPVRLRPGQLALGPGRALAAGGFVEMSAQLSPEMAQIHLAGQGVKAGGLAQSMGFDALSGGPLDFALDLSGRGATPQAVMAGANGALVARMGAAQLGGGADWMGRDLLLQLVSNLNPVADQDRKMAVECAVVRFAVKDGQARADKSLALESDRINVTGSGHIDLSQESLDVRLVPRARDGFGISLAGQVASVTRLGGTLSRPALTLDQVGVAKSAASVGAAVASGGLSVLGEVLFDKITADPHPCQTALGQTAARAANAGKPAIRKTFEKRP